MTATPNHALQRTAPRVTAAASGLRLSPTAQPPRRAPQSLSLGSLGRSTTYCIKLMTMKTTLALRIVLLSALALCSCSKREHTVTYEVTPKPNAAALVIHYVDSLSGDEKEA